MNYGNFGEEGSDSMGDFGNKEIVLGNDDANKYEGKGNKSNKRQESGENKSQGSNQKEFQYQTKDATITEQVSSQTMSYISKFFGCLGPYFDVDLSDVVSRIKGALIPFNKSFYESAKDNPDIYGPFWIFTTIIFLITVCANFSGYMNSPTGKFQYNFNFLPYACLFIFGTGFGVPLAIFLVGRFICKIDFGYVLNLCLYGYSFVILIPILLLCMIPSNALEFILLVYYTIHSGAFLVFNMYNIICEKAPNAKYIMLGILGGVQLVLFFGLRFYFFKHANVQINPEEITA